MERMKNLEIDRLKLELNERSDEVTKLEIEVEEERKTVKGHLQRVSALYALDPLLTSDYHVID
jgi:hypothetical protein